MTFSRAYVGRHLLFRAIPWRSSGQDSVLSLLWAWVQYCKPQGRVAGRKEKKHLLFSHWVSVSGEAKWRHKLIYRKVLKMLTNYWGFNCNVFSNVEMNGM